jgi:hypothetical protein
MTQPYRMDGAEGQGHGHGQDTSRRNGGDDRPLGVIVNDLWEKAETLVRQEVKLALTEAEEKVNALKIEVQQDVDKLKLEVFAKLVGGATVFIGVLAIAAALILLLAKAIDPWLSALIVGLAVGGGGIALLKREMKLPAAPDAASVVPQRTIQSLKADAKTIQEASRDATS